MVHTGVFRMTTSLEKEKCVPCSGGVPTLTDAEIDMYYSQLRKEWSVAKRDGIKRVEKSFKFKDFSEALAFTNKVGELAEKEGHQDRKSTRLNSSHGYISYAVFCLKKK